ncbi:FG-GAP repeat protein [Thiolapillus sp.]|uniref:FG-GAP repeat protein n=1 Tax=Thiolapillus sp. TaxID=2017437 RepID=UPI003AF87FE1
MKGYISQTDNGERAGEMLAVGDLNGDTYDDLVIVAQNGHKDYHKIYIVFGSMNLTGGSLAGADVVITRTRGANVPSTWATFRVSAITTGDLDRDGYDDLVFSDRLNNRFEVLRGRSAGKWPATMDLWLRIQILPTCTASPGILFRT